jgi:predicted DNA-binding transcriptional regulator YafY
MKEVADPAERLLALLSLLQRRVRWTGPQLADQLGVTTRTVRRDIDRLRNLGYPVDAAPGAEGGYQLGRGGDLPPLLLDDDEATAVAVALGASTATAALGIEDIALAALAKLHRLLPPRIRSRIQALTTTTDLLAYPAEAVAPGVLADLAAAIEIEERVLLTYADREGRRSERRVDPYRLVATNRRWYLLAFDIDRDDWRTFRADRVEEARPTGHRFDPVERPDAARMVSEAISTAPYRFPATIRIEAPADELRRRIPPTVGVITDDGHTGAVLRIGSDHLPSLAGHLVALDLPFEVVDPPELREHLHRLGQALTHRHLPRPTPTRP